MTCPWIAILFPNIPLSERFPTQTDPRILVGLLVLMMVASYHFIKATVSKETVVIWTFVSIISLLTLWLIISNQAFKKTAFESEIIIVRSAIIYDQRSSARSMSCWLSVYFYRDGKTVRQSVSTARRRCLEVNIGDTILIMQTINDWQGIRIFDLNPTSEKKIKGLEGFEMGRSTLERNEN